MSSKIDVYKKNALFAEVKEYCYLSKEHDYMEVTEWHNGDGFDVEISGTYTEKISMTWGQFKLLKKMVKQLKQIQDERN